MFVIINHYIKNIIILLTYSFLGLHPVIRFPLYTSSTLLLYHVLYE